MADSIPAAFACAQPPLIALSVCAICLDGRGSSTICIHRKDSLPPSGRSELKRSQARFAAFSTHPQRPLVCISIVAGVSRLLLFVILVLIDPFISFLSISIPVSISAPREHASTS
jgi:hypothetical protein